MCSMGLVSGSDCWLAGRLAGFEDVTSLLLLLYSAAMAILIFKVIYLFSSPPSVDGSSILMCRR